MRGKIGIFVLFCLFISCARRGDVPLDCIYPLGDLFLSKKQLEWGTVHLGWEYRDSIKIYNPTSQNITITQFNNLPEIKISQLEDGIFIPPRKYRTIAFCLNVKDSSLIGQYNQGICLKTNNEVLLTPITMRAEVLENFTMADTSFWPRIEILKDTFDFGTISSKSKASVSIPINNIGNKNLIIRKIESSCGCTSAIVGRDVIFPNTSSTLEVSFKGAGKMGFQQKSVTLYCNDPRNPICHMIIKGNVN